MDNKLKKWGGFLSLIKKKSIYARCAFFEDEKLYVCKGEIQEPERELLLPISFVGERESKAIVETIFLFFEFIKGELISRSGEGRSSTSLYVKRAKGHAPLSLSLTL